MRVAKAQAVRVGRRPFRTKTLRLLSREKTIFDQACEALNGMERSQLMQEAVINEATRLGVHWSIDPVPPLTSPWPHMPERGNEPTGVRVSITTSLSVAELITRAAEHVQASEPLFIIGATLAHVGRLKACFKVSAAGSREEARAIRSALEKVKLPPQHQYPGQTTRR
jgi:uncharacterized protein (DUF1778 family)